MLHNCITMHGARNVKSGSRCCNLLFIWKYDYVNSQNTNHFLLLNDLSIAAKYSVGLCSKRLPEGGVHLSNLLEFVNFPAPVGYYTVPSETEYIAIFV